MVTATVRPSGSGTGQPVEPPQDHALAKRPRAHRDLLEAEHVEGLVGDDRPGQQLLRPAGRDAGQLRTGRRRHAGELLEGLAVQGFDGLVVVEVNTRKCEDRAEREADLAEALAFTRLHLAAPAEADTSAFKR